MSILDRVVAAATSGGKETLLNLVHWRSVGVHDALVEYGGHRAASQRCKPL